MRRRLVGLRLVLGPAGVILALALVLPPAVGDASHNAVVQALQWLVFAVATPALLALGRAAPMIRVRRLMPFPSQPGLIAAVTLLPYLVLVVAWRLPAAVTAQAGSQGLTVLEMVTLVPAGYLLWAALIGRAPAARPLSRPHRAAMAAIAMWTIWVIAYITGMSVTGLTHARAGADSRELAVGIMWAVSAVCYVPVVYVLLMRWLGARDEADLDAGQQPEELAWPQPGSQLPPPRGWGR
jgi:cytochrome c oxidase assembly factor CtaG